MISEAEREKLHVGYKQAVRALNEDKAAKVFVAEDCDDNIKNGIGKIASQNNTPVFFIPTMKELGSICSIEVGASCAVILK
jgi:large subunit ribosomal protein L7A